MASQRSCGAFLMSGRCKLACIRTDIGKAQEGRRPGMPFDPLQGPLRRGVRDVAPCATIPPGFTRRDTDEGPVPSVSRQQKPPFRPKTVRDTDDMGHWSVSRRNKEKVWVQAPEGRRDKSREMMDKVKITVVMYQELTKNS